MAHHGTLVDDGLIRHKGFQSFCQKVERFAGTGSHCIKPEVNQIERHAYSLQKELVKFAISNGFHITNYASLGSGDRFASLKAEDKPILLQDVTVKSIAEHVRSTPAGVLFKWALQEGTLVIPKSVSSKRLEQNMQADPTVAT
eukprot:scaffold5684_cov169-Amphora_coffeaeformis.AAC.2